MPDLLLATPGVDRYQDGLASVYRIFNEHGVNLYIGFTNCPLMRMKGHRWMQWYGWWQWAATINVDPALTRVAAKAAELTAIGSERPLYNRIGLRRCAPGSIPAVAIEPGQVGRYKAPPGQRDRFLDTPPTGTLQDFEQNWQINVYEIGSERLLAVG